MYKIFKKGWIDFFNIVLILSFISFSLSFLEAGKLEEVKVLLYVFTASFVFLNLNRFSVIKTPFLSAELKKASEEAFTSKKELDKSILESKNTLNKMQKEMENIESLAIAGL